jgi:succinyl-CoA synthetase alpha subunit
MGILLGSETRVCVQGITGRDGCFHAHAMSAYGTRVVGGTRPGKGGTTHEGFSVFDTVAECRAATGCNASAIYVPAAAAAEAICEAAEAGLELVVCITEGVPVLEMVRVLRLLEGTGTRLVGPNCPGVLRPGVASLGIIPGRIALPGRVGVVSRSGTLTYEVVHALTVAGIGQSTCVGIGGDPVIGTGFLDCLALFRDDPETSAVVLIGEIGGSDEQHAAEFIRRELGKPAVAFVAGRTAPPGKRMGHAGAIISGGEGTAEEKVAAFGAAGVPVAETPRQVAELVRERME